MNYKFLGASLANFGALAASMKIAIEWLQVTSLTIGIILGILALIDRKRNAKSSNPDSGNKGKPEK